MKRFIITVTAAAVLLGSAVAGSASTRPAFDAGGSTTVTWLARHADASTLELVARAATVAPSAALVGSSRTSALLVSTALRSVHFNAIDARNVSNKDQEFVQHWNAAVRQGQVSGSQNRALGHSDLIAKVLSRGAHSPISSNPRVQSGCADMVVSLAEMAALFVLVDVFVAERCPSGTAACVAQFKITAPAQESYLVSSARDIVACLA